MTRDNNGLPTDWNDKTGDYLTRDEHGQIDTQSEAAQTEEIARSRYELSAYELDKAVREFKRRDAVDEPDDDGGRLAGLKQVIFG